MTSVLLAVTGSDFWTFADGTKHPCGYWPEELAAPHRIFRKAGLDITVATPGGVVPTADQAGFTPEMNNGFRRGRTEASELPGQHRGRAVHTEGAGTAERA